MINEKKVKHKKILIFCIIFVLLTLVISVVMISLVKNKAVSDDNSENVSEDKSNSSVQIEEKEAPPDTITVDDTNEEEAESSLSENNIQKLIQYITLFGKQRLQALIDQDASVIQNVSEDIIKKYTNDIEFDIANEHYWKGELLNTKINISSLDEVEQNIYKVPVQFSMAQKEYITGINEQEPLEKITESIYLILEFELSNNQWKVLEVESIYIIPDNFMSGEDIIEN